MCTNEVYRRQSDTWIWHSKLEYLQQVEYVIPHTAGMMMGCCPSGDVVEDVLSNYNFLAAAVAK